MSDRVKKITAKERKRQQIIAFHDALLVCSTVEQAARQVGITARTATRWLKGEAFREIYVARRRASLESACDLLKAGSIGAIETLLAVTKNPDVRGTAKVQAASKLIDSMLRIIETHEIQQRLERLEGQSL